jgi:hypothetical protein
VILIRVMLYVQMLHMLQKVPVVRGGIRSMGSAINDFS